MTLRGRTAHPPHAPRGEQPWGLSLRKQLLVEGLGLLRLMATRPIDRAAAERAGIHRREFYRWLEAFRACGIPIERVQAPPPDQRTIWYRLPRRAWAALIRSPP